MKKTEFVYQPKYGIVVLRRFEGGTLTYTPQNEAVATWEPPIEKARLFRPELLQLP